MVGPLKGDVVVTLFPYSDLSNAKRRPALVLAPLEGEDVILCQITSKLKADPYAVSLEAADFSSGRLRVSSNIRPNRLFTADRRIIVYQAGRLTDRKLEEVLAKVSEIFGI